MKRYLALQKIVQYGSFAKAAEEIGYTQSALSQAIASLEDELGMTLLTRSRTGSALTDEGKELYPYIERTIFQYRASVEKAKEINGLETGIVRMGTVASVSVNWLPGILKNFHKMYPGGSTAEKVSSISGKTSIPFTCSLLTNPKSISPDFSHSSIIV